MVPCAQVSHTIRLGDTDAWSNKATSTRGGLPRHRALQGECRSTHKHQNKSSDLYAARHHSERVAISQRC